MRRAVEFRSARTVEEALAWLAELGSDACVIAGGTDVMMQYARGELSPKIFLHIGGISGLAGIERNGSVRLGALATHRQLATDAALRTSNPALAESAATVGGWQTQSVGTVGGNLCNASPAADSAPPLLAAGAVVTLLGPSGSRRVPLDNFLLGRRRVDRRDDELLQSVEVEPLPAGAGEVYLKVGRRGAMVVAVVGLAARLSFDAAGRVNAARLALCSVAPTALRVPAAEEALIGAGVAAAASDPAVAAAGAELASASAPIDDARSSAGYRRAVLGGLLARAVEVCGERAGLPRAGASS